MSQEPGTQARRVEHAQEIHSAGLPGASVTQILNRILPPPIQGYGRRQAMLELFEGRVTRQAIINWRKGRRAIPDWARAILIRQLDNLDAANEHDRAIITPK